ncbi:MAG: hypothetical protein WCX88_01790 [Patescibacteria group bacterium]
MTIDIWGDKPKSQVDPTTVDQEIAALIAAHEADENAHLEVGESLQSHKASEIIDHLAKSIVEDKLDDGAISSRCITTDQLVGKDIRTAEDVGSTVDGVKMVPTGIEMWQDGEKKVDIPVSGDPSFAGNVAVGFLTFSKTVFMTWFESIDGWFQDFGSGVIHALFGGATFEASGTPDEITMIGMQPEMTQSLDFSKNPLFQTRFELQDSDVNNIYFGLGDCTYGDGKYAAFKYSSGHLYAVNSNGSTVASTDLGTLSLYESHLYTVKIISGTSVLFYIDGVLVATHTTYKPTGLNSMFVAFVIYSGSSASVVCACSHMLFVQDL